ncbi:excalibur calcium-binding domain-containing protein [Actinomycetospora atypica]|uniref:Excalibur calcium-binding domain-containing protein n=1 Tax=Actinomycetospora atypica TaxID=1290095 RepID=A0ABV9YRB7_9PSEU
MAHKVWSGIAAGVFCLVAGVDLATPATTVPTAPAASSYASTSPYAPAAGVGVGGADTTSTQQVSVLEVIDGDSFRTADGLEVRVLGIDACEAATAGGRRATDAARSMLVGATVVLEREPGVEDDRYGRALRYVTADGRDFGEAAVVADHTAIYTDGRNDASPTRQATLRALDTNGRTCAALPTSRRPVPVPDPDPDVDRPATRLPAVPDPAPAPSSAYYKNCAAAKAAGAAPLHTGDPGYSSKLDRDGDGVACVR